MESSMRGSLNCPDCMLCLIIAIICMEQAHTIYHLLSTIRQAESRLLSLLRELAMAFSCMSSLHWRLYMSSSSTRVSSRTSTTFILMFLRSSSRELPRELLLCSKASFARRLSSRRLLTACSYSYSLPALSLCYFNDFSVLARSSYAFCLRRSAISACFLASQSSCLSLSAQVLQLLSVLSQFSWRRAMCVLQSLRSSAFFFTLYQNMATRYSSQAFALSRYPSTRFNYSLKVSAERPKSFLAASCSLRSCFLPVLSALISAANSLRVTLSLQTSSLNLRSRSSWAAMVRYCQFKFVFKSSFSFQTATSYCNCAYTAASARRRALLDYYSLPARLVIYWMWAVCVLLNCSRMRETSSGSDDWMGRMG